MGLTAQQSVINIIENISLYLLQTSAKLKAKIAQFLRVSVTKSL